MHEVTIQEASDQLPKLIDEMSAGEEIVITSGSRPVAKLVPVLAGKRPGYGSMKGRIKMSDDFDAPLEDFKDYS